MRAWFGTHIAYQEGEIATPTVGTFRFSGGVMSVFLMFARKWVRWYRVLRYGKAFSFIASVRSGLWLARS
jgi:hypothetical protein